ncbi:MAG: Rps23 Pro-64 3,4-dihydroxylase Tpa1-like proline 4-hydroxylase [Planctomycetota bacterium]|jgi:Rps23 Pro-64 3,4-dihydroxylase Tpa1-like proline 4-hydroxylase
MKNTITEVKPGSFIFQKPNALAQDICAEMIARFEQREQDQYPGRIGQLGDSYPEVKRSTDLLVSNNPDWKDIDAELFRSLNQAMHEFKERYEFFNGPFKDMGYGIQRTLPGEFYHWHIDGGSHEFANRQLVAIWYLNTLSDTGGDAGGETEFAHQDVEITPQAGNLILFPPFWTHLHRGRILDQGIKYIATTWVVFA